MFFFAFCLILIILFFLSQHLTRSLSQLFLRVFRSQSVTIYLLSFLFLPGVTLHELSHLLVASILFVPTGEVEFLPEVRGSEVKMGSVAIGKTDPLRRFLIGVAPLLGGLGIILLVTSYFTHPVFWQGALLLFIIFEIANTMFSSKKDMEGALGFLGAGVVLVILLQVFRIPLVQSLFAWIELPGVNLFFKQASMFLFIALGIDGVSLLLTHAALTVKKY